MTRRSWHEVPSISCLPFCSQITFFFISQKVRDTMLKILEDDRSLCLSSRCEISGNWKNVTFFLLWYLNDLVTVSSTKHWVKIVSSWVNCHTTLGWFIGNVYLMWKFVSNEMLLCMNILPFVKSWNNWVEWNLQKGPVQDWWYILVWIFWSHRPWKGAGRGRGLLEKRNNLPAFLISILTTTCELLVAIRQSLGVLPFQVYTEVWMQFVLTFFTPKSDKHLISPCCITP